MARALSPAKVSSVTVGEADPDGGQRSVLVIVPDSQLSLAIGKRGQNARLAAKLTGLRVDIKSESEVEEERRREEEERIEGREALSGFSGIGPQLLDKLVDAGLFSPARIVRAGMEALLDLPNVGEKKALALYEAAQSWVSRARGVPELPEDLGESGPESAMQEGEMREGGEPEEHPVPRTSAE